MRSKRTKATDITTATRKAVLKRDRDRCIFCHKPSEHLTMAHIVPRSSGGLGIEENLVSACPVCHEQLDHTGQRAIMLEYAKKYLDRFNYERQEMRFRKGE